MKTLLLFVTLFLTACTATKFIVDDKGVPFPPDYSNSAHWAALPTKNDNADRVPDADSIQDNQAIAPADVFFLHPTIYTGRRRNKPWNAAVNDPKLNQAVDESTILHQASIFNGAGRVYAPRYRQAHLSAYYTKDRQAAEAAFELAYSDVKAAFEYYLKHYNAGRPIIIASHSQGTTHAKRLLKAFFDGKQLQNQLIAAYLVGIPVESDYFQEIKPCDSPNEIGCFVSWRAYRKGYYPKNHTKNNGLVVTNPLTWNRTNTLAPKTLNKGAMLRKFGKLHPHLAEAQVQDGLLWLERPKFPGSFLLTNPNYHVGDYNLYYMNVRQNAMDRVHAFLNR